MKLLPKEQYDKIEELLKINTDWVTLDEPYKTAMKDITQFFDVDVYRDFLKLFYFERYKYKNRCPDNRSMLRYLSKILYVQEPTLYMMRKEIVYKSAMIFYKYSILK